MLQIIENNIPNFQFVMSRQSQFSLAMSLGAVRNSEIIKKFKLLTLLRLLFPQNLLNNNYNSIHIVEFLIEVSRLSPNTPMRAFKSRFRWVGRFMVESKFFKIDC